MLVNHNQRQLSQLVDDFKDRLIDQLKNMTSEDWRDVDVLFLGAMGRVTA